MLNVFFINIEFMGSCCMNKNIVKSKIDSTLVRNLTRLCQELGILTIAEFVESEEILEALQEMGGDYAQGFHLGIPASQMP